MCCDAMCSVGVSKGHVGDGEYLFRHVLFVIDVNMFIFYGLSD